MDNANLTRFMHALGVDSFETRNARASADPVWFNDELIRFIDDRFERPYNEVLNLSEGLPFAHWCVGGTTNVVLNCIDRHRDTARFTQAALIWEGEDGTVTNWTFANLDRDTCRLAWGLRRLGLGPGDVVLLAEGAPNYPPPEDEAPRGPVRLAGRRPGRPEHPGQPGSRAGDLRSARGAR